MADQNRGRGEINPLFKKFYETIYDPQRQRNHLVNVVKYVS
jgi:hypothetical protein